MLLNIIPFWTNILIRTFAVVELIRNEGTINTLLMWTGIIDEPIQMLFTEFSILVGMIYVYLPLMVLPLYASMERLDFSLVEAGYDLYATRMKVLRRIILPLVKPGVIAGSILVFVPSLGAYVTPRDGWRQPVDDRQPDRAAIRTGPQLAIGGGAVDHLAGHRDGGADGIRARSRKRGPGTWLNAFKFNRCRGFEPSRL